MTRTCAPDGADADAADAAEDGALAFVFATSGFFLLSLSDLLFGASMVMPGMDLMSCGESD